MPSSPPPGVDVLDHWVLHPQGRLFARSWSPAQATAAPPILLFHDSLGCVALWRDFPLALCQATGRRIIAYDRLGFGQSDARLDRPGLDFVAEEASVYLPALRDQLGLGRFIPLGHSVGGGMALCCAATFPQQCAAVVTEAAQVFAEDRTLQGIRAAKIQFGDPAQFERLARYHGAKARWVLEAWTENWLHPDFASWSLAAVLPRVQCPVLALHGTLDEYGSTRHPELIGQHCAGPRRIEVVEGMGHVPHRERPDLVRDLVAGFVASVAP